MGLRRTVVGDVSRPQGTGEGSRRGSEGGLLASMETWNALVRRVAANGGVGTPADARACGVSEATWHRRTRAEQWGRPYRSVRVAPWAVPGRLTDLRSVLAACGSGAVAAGWTAPWLEGMREEPSTFDLLVPHGVTRPRLRAHDVRIRMSRWLRPGDVTRVLGLACLRPEPLVVSMAPRGHRAIRSAVIDLVQAGRTTADRVLQRVAAVGPVEGRGDLEAVLTDLGARRPESWFHDIVLTELLDRGYPAAPEPAHVETPDGRGLRLDIPLPDFRVAVEPEGDRFHRGRSRRWTDRRRIGQTAGTDWVIVPVDWRDWYDRRDWVLATVDGAILRQRRAGFGAHRKLPPHLRPGR